MTKEEMLMVKAGDVLATKYGRLILVERVEVAAGSVCVYFYFDYDEEIGLQMNEWLTGFYGPKFDDDAFYRHATDEEKTFLLNKIREYGYELREEYGKLTPRMTEQEYNKRHPKAEQPSPHEGLDEAAEGYVQTLCDRADENLRIDTTLQSAFKAGAEWMAGQFEKNRLAACDAQTKEEYDRETELVDKIVIEEHRMPTFIDAINYGINWQKQQMMKEAVEGKVIAGKDGSQHIQTIVGDWKDILPENVKILILKNNE